MKSVGKIVSQPQYNFITVTTRGRHDMILGAVINGEGLKHLLVNKKKEKGKTNKM